jgi:tetratricopeptide (TPR) repeat protein
MSASLSDLLSGIRSDKTRLECQLGITAFAAAYLYFWAFESMLGLHLKLVPFDLFLKTPLISLAVFPLVFYGYVKADPLQRSHLGWQSVRFFQAEFPSLYIRERGQSCGVKARCPNFISPASNDHTTYWLSVPIAILISALPTPAQTPVPDSTVIPGIVEPLELRGEAQGLVEPSELERRLADALPKSNDSHELKRSMEAVNAIIQEYPNSIQALSTRLTLSCQIDSTDAPISATDIDELIRLQRSAASENKEPVLLSEPELLTMKAKVEYDTGNHKKAVEDLYAAISLDVHNADNVLNSGAVGPENKSEPCAWYKPDLDQLVKDYPSDYRVYLFRGLQYAAFARFDSTGKYLQPAIADYDRAAVLNPRSPLPPYFSGRLYLSNLAVLFGTDPKTADKRAKALAAYNKAVQIDPHFTEGYFDRAELYLDLKEYKHAIHNFDIVVEANPKVEGACHDRGVAKLQLNDFYGAISDFSCALDNKLADPKLAYENRADAYVKVGDYENATKDYTQAIKIEFGQELFLMNIVQVKKLYPEYKNVSDDVLCRKLHAMFFRNMKYEDFAKQLTDVNMKKGDFDSFLLPDLFVKRADAYLKSGDYRRAIADYRRTAGGFAYGRKTLDRWHLISKGSQELYIDSETAELDNPSSPKFWLKLVDTKPTVKGAYTVEQWAVDCQLKKVEIFSFIKYDAKGNVLASNDSPTGWESTAPDSLGEQLYTGMCH